MLACGGEAVVTDAGDSGPDGTAFDGGTPDDAGFTACSTPEGLAICGTATPCAVLGSPPCQACTFPEAGVSICTDTVVNGFHGSCAACGDGLVCIDQSGGTVANEGLVCVDYNLGVLIAKYDAALVHYADLGDWTGDPLPKPATCPGVSGFTLCGGNCGGCSAGEVCTGRSPLHPYGFCFDALGERCTADKSVPCDADAGPQSCFVFNVQPDAQPIANDYGKCMSPAMCQAIATGLPGGGTCYAQ